MRPRFIGSAAAVMGTLLLAAGPARAGVVDHPLFTLTYPEDWRPLDEEQSSSKTSVRPNRRLQAILIGPVFNGFPAHVEISVIDREFDEYALRDAARRVSASKKFGGTGIPSVVEKGEFGGNPALSADTDFVEEGATFHQWTVCFPVAGQTVIVKCIAERDAYSAAAPAFREMINGIRLKPGWPGWVKATIAVGGFGVAAWLAVLVVRLFRRSEPAESFLAARKAPDWLKPVNKSPKP